MVDYEPPSRVFGVDFSADRARAGEKLWIAEGVVAAADGGTAVDADGKPAGDADPGFRIVDCRRATGYLGVDRRRAASIPALTRFLGGLEGDAVAGLDFPFGLPAEVVAADAWPAFLRQLPGWADDPQDLARESEARAALDGDAAGLRRATEEPLGALSPYDPRLRAQAFYGIRDVLRPLVLADAVRALPMQPLASDRPYLLEVYPAGTLDRLGCHRTRYKSDDEPARARRVENLDALAAAGVELPDAVRERAVEDADGDALDAVVAAFAAFQHTRDPSDLQVDDGERALEGHIYV